MPTPTAGRKPTRKQELFAAISSAGSNLKISKATINGLAKFAVNASEATVASLLELLAQPDPRGSLAASLAYRLREMQGDYHKGSDEADLAQWIRSANSFFHELDEMMIQRIPRARESVNDHLTSRFIQGAVHYRVEGMDYTEDQIKRFAMVAAASHFTEVECNYREGPNAGSSLTSEDDSAKISGHDHFWCHHLHSEKTRNLIVSEPSITGRILDLIGKYEVHTEEALFHHLEGGHGTLVRGLL